MGAVGWRLGKRSERAREFRMTAVDFDGEGYLGDSPVRPRLGLALWFAAAAIAGRAELFPWSVTGGLPSIAKRWGEDPGWATQLMDCYRMVRDRLAVAAFPIARCTGEEFALHLTIAAAAELTAQGLGPDPAAHGMQLLPAPDSDDFVQAHLDLFEDNEIMALFDPLFDGIEDVGGADNQRLGIGPYLHPSRWFDAFPGYDRGDPLGRLDLVVDSEDEVIVAAAGLALQAGARGTVTVTQDGTRWLARARYPGRELVGEGDDPQSAATALARLILEGHSCPSCGDPITVDPGAPAGRCLWARHGRAWQPGCT